MENGSTPRSETLATRSERPPAALRRACSASACAAPARSPRRPGSTAPSRSPPRRRSSPRSRARRSSGRWPGCCEGPIVEEAVEGALESEAVKKALLEAMDTELVDEVWRRLLASDQAQQLVERIAEAPEVRAAISAQGIGLLEDIGRTIGNARPPPRRPLRADRPPDLLPPAPRPLPTDRAGVVSRGLAMLIDGVFVNLGFTAFVALVTLVDNAFGGNGERRLAASRSRSARPPGWRSARSTCSASGRWPGRRRGCASSASASSEPAAAAALLQAPRRPRPLGRHLRPRLPRHRLRRASPRLGRPLLRHRGRLRRAPPGAGAVVASRR